MYIEKVLKQEDVGRLLASAPWIHRGTVTDVLGWSRSGRVTDLISGAANIPTEELKKIVNLIKSRPVPKIEMKYKHEEKPDGFENVVLYFTKLGMNGNILPEPPELQSVLDWIRQNAYYSDEDKEALRKFLTFKPKGSKRPLFRTSILANSIGWDQGLMSGWINKKKAQYKLRSISAPVMTKLLTELSKLDEWKNL